MTLQEQDAVAGRLIRERQDLNRRVVVARAESKRLGDRLIELGRAATHCEVALENEEVSAEFDHYNNPLYRITLEEFDELKKVITLARDYRASMEGLRERTQQLKAIGVEAQ